MPKYKLFVLFCFAFIVLTCFIKCSNLFDPSEPGNFVPQTADERNIEHADHVLKINGSIFHMETDPAPFWRISATANIYLQEELNNNGNAVYDFTSHLHQFTNKVLFLVSSRNEIVGKDFQEKQMQAFPKAECKCNRLSWAFTLV